MLFKGVSGLVEGRTVVVGSLQYILEQRIEYPDHDSHHSDMTVYVGIDGVVVGQFILEDRIRDTSRDGIRMCQEIGIETYLVTGDKLLTAQDVGREVGIAAQNIFAAVSPEGKLDIVKRFNEKGKQGTYVQTLLAVVKTIQYCCTTCPNVIP